MPLRLANRERTYPVTVCDTVFHVISMTIAEKETLLYKLSHISSWVNTEGASFAALLELIAPVITKVDGYEGKKPIDVLLQLEDVKQLHDIIQAVIAHCDLSEKESKNSSSLSVQPNPESAGNVVNLVAPDGVPVSIIPIQQATS